MFEFNHENITILDAGAGSGSLFSACIDEILSRGLRPKSISVTAFEIDKSLSPFINRSSRICRTECEKAGIPFNYKLITTDFISYTLDKLSAQNHQLFNCVILNPPYKEFCHSSKQYRQLNKSGIHTLNLYSAFIAVSQRILTNNGELVCITPRSFCNGPMFQRFRESFLQSMILKKIHLFRSRERQFPEDNILQENIVIYAIKSSKPRRKVTISVNDYPGDISHYSCNSIDYDTIVSGEDPYHFIRIVPDEEAKRIIHKMAHLKSTLDELNIQVSTGKIVDFRSKRILTYKGGIGRAPLLYPAHITNGFVKFPTKDLKSYYVKISSKSKKYLLAKGNYVLVRRFSSKEERRRIISAFCDSSLFSPFVAFENRLNYYHSNGNGLNDEIAKGLALFLNSKLVDSYFRIFSGHTQVNATDLRSLRYPSAEELRILATYITDKFPSEDEIDRIIETEIFNKALSPFVTK